MTEPDVNGGALDDVTLRCLHGHDALAKPELLLYLSGSIQKGSHDERPATSFWSDDDERCLIEGVPNAAVQPLNPARSKLRRNDYYANFGCDLHLVNIADAVLVDARTKKGIGIGAEMMFAQFVGVPILTICPPSSPYRQELLSGVYGEDLQDWIHPFIYGLSDYIVDSVQEAAVLLDALGKEGLKRKSRPDVFDAIDYYNRIRESIDRSA